MRGARPWCFTAGTSARVLLETRVIKRRDGSPHQAKSRDFLATLCRRSAAVLTAKLGTCDLTSDHVIALLRGSGALPTDGSESPDEHRDVCDAALDRLRQSLRIGIEIALRAAIADDRQYLQKIRAFFTQPTDAYTLEDLAALWSIPATELRDVFHDEVDRWTETHPDAPDRCLITREDALRAVDMFGIVRPVDVERALGSDFVRLRPPSCRTVPLLIYLPRFVVDAVLADRDRGDEWSADARIEQFIRDCVASEHLPVNNADGMVSAS